MGSGFRVMPFVFSPRELVGAVAVRLVHRLKWSVMRSLKLCVHHSWLQSTWVLITINILLQVSIQMSRNSPFLPQIRKAHFPERTNKETKELQMYFGSIMKIMDI